MAISTLAVAVAGCAPSSSTVAAAPVTAPGENPCARAEFSPQQFTGDWIEPGDTTIITLGADGTLSTREGGASRSGSWSYQPWEFTPGKAQMPTGEADHCVLWLHWTSPAPVSDLVYVPREVGSTAMRLSFVGRGNTLNWVRPTSTA